MRGKIVSALAKLSRMGIRQEATRTFKWHRLAHFSATLMVLSRSSSHCTEELRRMQ